MGNYDQPDVIYRGYLIPHAKYNALMKKIPSYKQLMLSDYGEQSPLLLWPVEDLRSGRGVEEAGA
jgi:hypothetical protein